MKTYRQQFNEALACNTKAEADVWLEKEIIASGSAGGESCNLPYDERRKIILDTLGYMSGYYDLETGAKIYELFGAEHPIFGAPNNRTKLKPQDLLEAGEALGRVLADGGNLKQAIAASRKVLKTDT